MTSTQLRELLLKNFDKISEFTKDGITVFTTNSFCKTHLSSPNDTPPTFTFTLNPRLNELKIWKKTQNDTFFKVLKLDEMKPYQVESFLEVIII